MEISERLLDFYGTNDTSVVSLSKPNKADTGGQVLLPWDAGGMPDLCFLKYQHMYLFEK